MVEKTHLVLGLLALLAVYLYSIPAAQTLSEFQSFKLKHGKVYTLAEEAYRFQIFTRNVAALYAHNADTTQTYQMGINQFTDMTHEEFVEKMLMNGIPQPVKVDGAGLPKVDPPTDVDWRSKGKVTDVKNQGGCGSCWAFSTTGTLESAISIANGESNNFSEQQLVDCCGSKGYECQGCSGAWPEWAVNYINKEGIVQQKEYPYTGVGGSCKPIPSAKKILNSARPWTILTSSSDQCTQLKTAVASAPVSVCLDASNWGAYRSGVFSNCGKTNLNHAVLLVGYSADGVWLVKNSWGATWGDSGYIRLAKGNTCGIAAHALTVNLA